MEKILNFFGGLCFGNIVGIAIWDNIFGRGEALLVLLFNITVTCIYYAFFVKHKHLINEK